MVSPSQISVKAKIIITISTIWAVVSLIISLGITSDNDEGYFLENASNFLTSFLVFTAPVWIYWSSLWIWGDGIHNAPKNLLKKFFKIIRTVNKNKASLFRKLSYILMLLIIMAISGSIARSLVKGFFDNKKAIATLESLGATKDEIISLTAKIRNYEGNFESLLYEEKDFRAILLRNAVSSISKDLPIRIDDLTYLVDVSTDGDRTLSYKYKVNLDYNEGNRIYSEYSKLMYSDRKKYWCHDDKAVEFRKMNSKILYEHFSRDMIFIGSYLFDIEKECPDLYRAYEATVYEEKIEGYR